MKYTGPTFGDGIIFALIFMSLRQDYYGLEGFISLLRESWTPAHFSVPLVIFLFIVVVLNNLYRWKKAQHAPRGSDSSRV